MNCPHAANFLALGVRTVQFCSIAMKYGVEIITELNSGLSHSLHRKAIGSVSKLVGQARSRPITDVMALPSEKQIPGCNANLCVSCGNCTRCEYLAVALDDSGKPHFDPARCVGCGFFTQHCPAGALALQPRHGSR